MPAGLVLQQSLPHQGGEAAQEGVSTGTKTATRGRCDGDRCDGDRVNRHRDQRPGRSHSCRCSHIHFISRWRSKIRNFIRHHIRHNIRHNICYNIRHNSRCCCNN
jgi:hypothetical protein